MAYNVFGDGGLQEAIRQVFSKLKTLLDGKVPTSDYAPVAKTSDMTQAVGKDANGQLWTAPSKKLLYRWEMTDDMYDYIVPIIGYDSETGAWETDGSVDLTTLPDYNTYNLNGPYARLVPVNYNQYIIDNSSSFTLPEQGTSAGMKNTEIKIKEKAIDATHFVDTSKVLPSGHQASEYVLKIYIKTGGFGAFRPELTVSSSIFGDYDNYEMHIIGGDETSASGARKYYSIFSNNFYAFAPVEKCTYAATSWGSIVHLDSNFTYHRVANTNNYFGKATSSMLIVNQHGYAPKALSMSLMYGHTYGLPWKDGNVTILGNRETQVPNAGTSITIWGWNNES